MTALTELTNRLANYANRLTEAADQNKGLWVIAGYAGDSTETKDLYCFCGEGKGYEGAALTPASISAVLFNSREEAQQALPGGYFRNGYNKIITLQVIEAGQFFTALAAEQRRIITELNKSQEDREAEALEAYRQELAENGRPDMSREAWIANYLETH